jgi:hypothetical protein
LEAPQVSFQAPPWIDGAIVERMSYRKKLVGAGVGYAIGGPVGAVVGVTLAGTSAYERGYDMSDVPFGLHVEEQHMDDAVGRQWTLHFLSDIPPESSAMLRVLNDAAQRVAGHSPFADDDGAFVASAPIRARRCALHIPFAAMAYDSPENLSLEVSVWVARAGSVTPLGKAILDAELPPR